MFLMRCLFTMFAELSICLPEDSFRGLLDDCGKDPTVRSAAGRSLEAMDDGEFAAIDARQSAQVQRRIFHEAHRAAARPEEIGELYEAAQTNWREVDPSIFGTLLEQALDPAERRRLGAHYTPRAYVERLVVATIIEPLRDDWRTCRPRRSRKRAAGDKDAAADA